MKRIFLPIALAASVLVLCGPQPIRAQEKETLSAREEAQNYFDSDEARKAVATVAEAAARNPEDRFLGAMLYSGIRDHVWHLPQCLPVKHGAPLQVLVFSADGTKLASGSENGEVLISSTESLNTEQAEAKRVRRKTDGPILGLTFTQDGQRLAAVTSAGLIGWSTGAANPVYTVPLAAGKVTTFATAPGQDLLALGTDAGQVRVFDSATGKVLAEWPQEGGAVQALAFSHSGKKLAVATGNRAVEVWEAATGRKMGAGVAHQKPIRAVGFSWDDRYVLSAGEDGVAWLSDPEAVVAVMPRINCGSPVRKAAFSPDGSMIATVLEDHSVSFWDAFTGKRLGFNLREDADINAFVWSRSGMFAATASEDGYAMLWTMRDGTRRGEPLPHEAPVRVAVLSPDSKLLATGCTDGVLRVWRTDGGMPLPAVRSHAATARTAFYSADGEHLITTGDDHVALHWLSGQLTPTGTALKHPGKVTCAVFDAEATRILTSDDSGLAQLWNGATGQADGAPFTHKGPVSWVDFSPDGKRCVTVSGTSAFIWNVADRKKALATIAHPVKAKSQLKCARFSPDGKWLVTASTDGTARVWDAATYRPTGTVLNRGYAVLCVRFSQDGSRLVVGGEDAQAVVYDTATWKPVGTPILAPGPVFSAAITQDNLFVVISALLLDSVQYFEIATGRPLGQGLPLPAQALCVDVNPTDKAVVVACDDGTVRALGGPFVTQNVPAWMIAFTERLIGLRKTGPNKFERVESDFEELKMYSSDAARGTNTDFPRLVSWKLSPGSQRNGMPRFRSTIAANIEKRVEDRSVNALFECYESVSSDPLIFAALSLYLPNPHQGEFLADMVLGMKEADEPARCLAAATLIRAGRSADAEAVIDAALAAAPNDVRVVRRAAKLNLRLYRKERAIELFEKALQLDPDDAETHRSYGWALYDFGEPAKAAAQFQEAQLRLGDWVEDLVAGMSLCAAAQKKDAEARNGFNRLVLLNPDWKKPEYIAGLRGWTQAQVGNLERIRQKTFPKK